MSDVQQPMSLASDLAQRHISRRPVAEVPCFDYLNLQGLRVTSPPDEGEFNIWVNAEQFPKLESCPHCGCDDEQFKRNGARSQIIRDEPHGLRSVYIEVHRQSYYCKRCQKPCQHPLSGFSETWRMTSRLVDCIRKMSLLRPAREVALLTGTSVKTVSEILFKYRQHLDQTVRFETPRVLGLDGVFARVKNEEGKSRRRDCAIFTDIEKGLVIDLRPGVTIAEVSKWLRRIPNREQIKIVLIDMSRALCSAVRKVLPHAIIIIDRFHVQRNINDGIDVLRKRLRAKLVRTKGQLTMCRKELLRKRRKQLKPSEAEELERWFEFKPELRLAYETVEECLEIWNSSSSEEARARYKHWIARFPRELRKDFNALLSVFKTWGKYIFNYFDYPFTNAFTESKNRLVKDIQRETRSCDFETLRARVIYGTLLKKQMEEVRREEMCRKKQKPPIQRIAIPQSQTKQKKSAKAESALNLAIAAGHIRPPVIQIELFE